MIRFYNIVWYSVKCQN